MYDRAFNMVTRNLSNSNPHTNHLYQYFNGLNGPTIMESATMKTEPIKTDESQSTDVTDLAVYASGRARVEHITQQVSSDYQVEVLQGEGADEPWGCKVRVKTDPTCRDI